MLKSRLQKLDGLTHAKLKENIEHVTSNIPKDKYSNIFKGAYERPEKYVSKNKTRKVKKNYLYTFEELNPHACGFILSKCYPFTDFTPALCAG